MPLLNGMLTSSHRFLHAVLSVEAGFVPGHGTKIRDEFRIFANDVKTTLAGLVSRTSPTRPAGQKWPDLREDHRRLIQNPLGIYEQYALVNVEADRMTNSLNTLREQVGALGEKKIGPPRWRRQAEQTEEPMTGPISGYQRDQAT